MLISLKNLKKKRLQDEVGIFSAYSLFAYLTLRLPD